MVKFLLFLFILVPLSRAWSFGCSILELQKLPKVKVYHCSDNTISFDQPDGKNSYNSLCGATAAANVFHAYCKNRFLDPIAFNDKYLSDLTPGVRPDTLEAGLNQAFANNKECLRGEWKYYYSKTGKDFLDSIYFELHRGNGYLNRKIGSRIKKISPVLVLTNSIGKNLHWVTVVDIIGYHPFYTAKDYKNAKDCKVIYNQAGFQSERTCLEFIAEANKVDDQWYTDLILPEYVHLVFEPK